MKKKGYKHGWKIILTGLITALLFYAGSAGSAPKEKKPPVTRYWVSAATQNFSIPGMPEDMEGMGGMFGSKMGPQKNLYLQLNSPKKLPPDPYATHDIPQGQLMGDTIPLLIPPAYKAKHEEGLEEKYKKPKARILLYWGCSEEVKKGQPRIIDTDKMSIEAFGKAMAGKTGSHQYPPSPQTGWIYSEWPNKLKVIEIPRNSSLTGDHFVHGNYTTDIRFSIGQKYDFMAPVSFTSVRGKLSESIYFQWRSIPTAIGYFGMAIANNERTGEMIIWTSSEIPETGFGLMNYLTPADVSRFIKEKVVMTPETTNCTIPKGIFKDAEGAALQFIAYGDELNVVYPPKPKEPVWTVKVRLKSTGMLPLGETMEQKQPKKHKRYKESTKPEGSYQQDENGTILPLKIFKGIFGD